MHEILGLGRTCCCGVGWCRTAVTTTRGSAAKKDINRFEFVPVPFHTPEQFGSCLWNICPILGDKDSYCHSWCQKKLRKLLLSWLTLTRFKPKAKRLQKLHAKQHTRFRSVLLLRNGLNEVNGPCLVRMLRTETFAVQLQTDQPCKRKVEDDLSCIWPRNNRSVKLKQEWTSVSQEQYKSVVQSVSSLQDDFLLLRPNGHVSGHEHDQTYTVST